MNQGPELGSTEITILIVVYGGLFALMIGIQLLVCWLMYRAAKALPVQYHSQASPGAAFLMLIPLFNIVWVFIYPKNLSLAYQAYFGSVNQLRDDCGEQHALYWAIAGVCSIIPCVGAIAGIVSLVFMVMYLVKISDCKKLAENLGGGGQFHDPYGNPVGSGPTTQNPYQR